MTSKVHSGHLTKKGHLLNLNLVLLFLNLGLSLAIGLRAYVSQFPPGRNRVADVLIRGASGVASFLQLAQGDQLGAEITFAALTTLLVLAAALGLHAISLSSIWPRLLSSVGGVVAIAALPICWLYISHMLWSIPTASVVEWLLLEVIPVACVFLYLYGKWSVPKWGTVSMIAVYYGFWSWIFAQPFPHEVTTFALPAVGAVSAIAWGLMVRKQRLGD
jgi:hypothetical protein